MNNNKTEGKSQEKTNTQKHSNRGYYTGLALGAFCGASTLFTCANFIEMYNNQVKSAHSIDLNNDGRKDLVIKTKPTLYPTKTEVLLQDSTGNYVPLTKFYEKRAEFLEDKINYIDKFIKLNKYMNKDTLTNIQYLNYKSAEADLKKYKTELTEIQMIQNSLDVNAKALQ